MAQFAIECMNGMVLEGGIRLMVSLEIVKEQKQAAAQRTKIYVAGFPFSWKSVELRQFFAVFGNIIAAKVVRNQDGTSRGFGFLDFSTPGSAQQAIQSMNGQKVEGGRELAVKLSEKQPAETSAANMAPGKKGAGTKAAEAEAVSSQVADELRDHLKQKEEEIEELRRQNAELSQELERSRQEVKKIDELEKQNQEVAEELTKSRKEAKQLQAELKNMQEAATRCYCGSFPESLPKPKRLQEQPKAPQEDTYKPPASFAEALRTPRKKDSSLRLLQGTTFLPFAAAALRSDMPQNLLLAFVALVVCASIVCLGNGCRLLLLAATRARHSRILIPTLREALVVDADWRAGQGA
eukprot:gnl/TRDRNA2_/TRDRNA2_31919_c0_seq2.p1 gnl/TRDRNA2_/TRDRNA2_31919_c0~~gnl/TRDRNA2_/TRDRNA2_31919_c0_seq2.p1  ORF type:complete len:367 (-),score=93.11 gnl/TRDRNA2_/TRDRNA2_31919_c0_seq2:77-1132(-)